MDKIKKTENFGKQMTKLRNKQSLTPQQLADTIDVSRRVIAYYEVGSASPWQHHHDFIKSIEHIG